MNRIIYKNKDNSVVVIVPDSRVLEVLGLEAIAEKDAPAPYKYPTAWETIAKIRDEDAYNEYEDSVETATVEYIEEVPTEWDEYSTPYWLVNDTDIPSDRTDRNRWVLEDMSEPDGFGGVSNEFTTLQLLKLWDAGVIK